MRFEWTVTLVTIFNDLELGMKVNEGNDGNDRTRAKDKVSNRVG